VVAIESNATTCPFALIAGPANRPLMSSPCWPSVLTLTRSVTDVEAVAPPVERIREVATNGRTALEVKLTRPIEVSLAPGPEADVSRTLRFAQEEAGDRPKPAWLR